MPEPIQQPFLFVDENLETPPYRQIADQLKGAIESGVLPGRALLPTVRQLAGDLEIAPNTVARAYGELQTEGWIVSDGRRGTRVADPSPEAAKSDRREGLRDAVVRFVRMQQQRGFSSAEIAGELARLADAKP
ncbi:MAG TPA: GntR family transcriptional regulator [Candidatus Tumulicola sp.]